MKNSDITIRDPFVLPYQGKYYLYGTRSHNTWGEHAYGVDVYVGDTLTDWEEPQEVFHRPENFWATKNYWAPEVYQIDDSFFMLITFNNATGPRGTQILRSDSPLGPFLPHSKEPVTPRHWQCLDGTLWEEDGQYYMIFAHEWIQIKNGSIECLPLKRDLTGAAGSSETLFRASDANWAREVDGEPGCYITDGPWLHRCEDGTLLMLWSSFGNEGYALGIAVSQSGRVKGPWHQMPEPLFARDGGHGMLFHSLSGELLLTLHTPNTYYHEHPVFISVKEQNGTIILA